jgi:hypothetical protein
MFAKGVFSATGTGGCGWGNLSRLRFCLGFIGSVVPFLSLPVATAARETFHVWLCTVPNGFMPELADHIHLEAFQIIRSESQNLGIVASISSANVCSIKIVVAFQENVTVGGSSSV